MYDYDPEIIIIEDGRGQDEPQRWTVRRILYLIIILITLLAFLAYLLLPVLSPPRRTPTPTAPFSQV